jgi:Pro-kumamolisin, activation domain
MGRFSLSKFIGRIARCVVLVSILPVILLAQQDRITGRVDRLQIRALRGNVHPSARPQFDAGPVNPSLQLHHIMLVFRRSDAQQAALSTLLAEQQDRSSPKYHQWLTPEQYGDRFGLSPSDTATVAAWLQSEGLGVDEVSRGRTWIWFSGTAGQVQTALRTNLRRYNVDGEMHFANADEPSVPAPIEPLLAGILGLDDFRPKALSHRARPLFTDGPGDHSMAPDDFSTIYDLSPLYKAGFDGSGQTIVVIGQSAVDLSDIQLFRTTYGLPPNVPQLILVPGSADPGQNSSEIEADLDLEWTGAIARNAQIIYVYSSNALTISIPYAINQNLAPVITYSFAGCEQSFPASLRVAMEDLAQQANAQGITWLASSGDSGAAACDPFGVANKPAASGGLAVSFPVSLPEVTGVGGTQFNESNSYWSASNSLTLASALSYIPETAWNESGPFGLAGTGGGLSVLVARPSWQSGLSLPSGNGRAVPDVSLSAGSQVGYRIVSAGQSEIVGGTSAAAPSFAGILVLANQYFLANGIQTQAGLGNVNPNLYSLGQNSGSVFHDITSGNNIVPCVIGTPDCSSGTMGYTAGPGYDLTTGLGSVDGYNLVLALATEPAILSISALNPSSVIAGGGGFTLAVNGSGFDSGSVVQWMGNALPTTFVTPTQLLATVNSALIANVGSPTLTVVSTRGISGPLTLTIAASPGVTFNSQRVTTTPPPTSVCGLPPAINSFLITDTVYLFFNATISSSDSISNDWLAPNGLVVAGGTWETMSGTICFEHAGSLVLGSLNLSNVVGTWQARIFDHGGLLFSIPFNVATSTANPFPAAGEVFQGSGGSGSVNLALPAAFAWTATSSANWISFPVSNSGTGNGTLSYQVASNPGASRSATITVAGYTFTIEQEAVSSGLNFVGSMPHIAAEENWNTTFTLVNKGPAAAQAQLSLFGDPSGPLTLPLTFPQQPTTPSSLLAAVLDQTIAANASLVIETAGPQTPPVQVGSAQLAASGAVDGFAIFHLIPGAQEAVVPMETRNASSYLLAFDNTGGVVLGVAVENVSPQAGTIGVIIRDDTGAPIGTGSLAMSANGHTSFVLSTQYPVTANKRGTVEFDTPAGGQISVLGIRTTPLGSSNTLTTIPALANVGTGGGSIAHIAAANGWQTTFVLVNTGTATSHLHLAFFDDGGSPLPLSLSFPQTGATSTVSLVDQNLAAGATLLIQASGPLANPVVIGSAQLTTNGNVGGFVIFRYNPNGQEAVVPMETRNAPAYLLAFDNTGGTATGVAINTVSTQAVSIPVIVRDETGVTVATDSLTLAANGHLAFTLVTDKYAAAANIRGTIEFATPAGAQMGALGIRIPVAHTFTTLPALAK